LLQLERAVEARVESARFTGTEPQIEDRCKAR
jgi:hypothetical protein